VFVTSTADAIDDPKAYGWVWTSTPDITATDDAVAMVMEVVERDEIEAAGDVRCGQVRIEDLTRPACALTAIKGSMQLTVADGRVPAGSTEVAVGSRVLDDVDAGIGDQVALTSVDGTEVTATVVGQAVGPMSTVRHAGDAVHVAPELADVLLPVEIVGEFSERFVGFRYADGVDGAALEAELAEQYPLDFPYYAHPEPPSLLSLLDQMRWLFLAAAAFLAAVGVVGLGHYLIVSVRRRRREFGVLRAIGLRRAQVRRTVSWQAATATGVGVTIGAPFGVVLGRNAWLLVVADEGLAVEPASAWWAVAVVIAVAVVGAAVLGAGPGWLVSRRSPAESLRVE
jgi:putative ABC transport system permease protein